MAPRCSIAAIAGMLSIITSYPLDPPLEVVAVAVAELEPLTATCINSTSTMHQA